MTQNLTHYFTGDKGMWTQTKGEEDVISSPETSYTYFSVWPGIRELMKNKILDSYQSLPSWYLKGKSSSTLEVNALNLITKPLSYTCITILLYS